MNAVYFLSAKVGPELLAAGCMPQPTDRFFFDLTDTLAGELEFLTDLLERQGVLAPQTEIQSYDFGLALAEGRERTFDLSAEGLLHQLVVGSRLALILDDVKQAVVLTLGKRRIHRKMSTGDLQRIGDLE